MIHRLRRRWLVIAFAIAALVSIALGTRLVVRAAYWSTHQDVAIEAWMTLGYVARSRGLAPGDLLEALGPGFLAGDRSTLAKLARDRGIATEDFIRQVDQAIAVARQSQR